MSLKQVLCPREGAETPIFGFDGSLSMFEYKKSVTPINYFTPFDGKKLNPLNLKISVNDRTFTPSNNRIYTH